jgi:mRNA-degrading endonuclease toxin of MazEF toxin-antitoxin module
LKHASVVNLDYLQTVERERLVSHVGSVGPGVMRRECAALAIAVGCGVNIFFTVFSVA